jgi:hypothetical protein
VRSLAMAVEPLVRTVERAIGRSKFVARPESASE